jgi:ligand-binding sensor domain-containing protein
MRFLTLATVPSLSSMVQHGANIVLSKDNGETFSLRTDQDYSRLRQAIPMTWNRSADSPGSRLSTLDHDLWLLGNDGLRRIEGEQADTQRSSSIPFSQWGQALFAHSLTTNLISALSIDSQDRLWAGSFRNGIDVLTPRGTLVSHIESESVREINFLTKDQKSETMLAGSSAGVLHFDPNLRPTERWTTNDGLLSNSVMQVARWNTDTDDSNDALLACATSKGLSLGKHGKLRGVTTVQGLPSNSLYAVLVQAGKTYVGTLGGLAVLERGQVSRVFKDTNSKLTPNWVTALCGIGPRVFVGTYGGGVFELTVSGELRAVPAETARAVVNPNAMWSDGFRLYVGTLDGALIFDLKSQAWTRVRSELPSRTVLSITGDEKYVYFGTTSGIARIERAYWNRNMPDKY